MKDYHVALFDRSPRLCRLATLKRGPSRMVISVAIIAATLILVWSPAQSVWSAGRPTPSGQAPPTAGNTPTPAPTPTPQPVINKDCASLSKSAPADWAVAMCDPFDDNSGGWEIGTFTQSLGTETRTVADGGYTWEMKAIKPFFTGRWANLAPMTDFYVAVDTHRGSGPEGNPQYGLQFRWQDNKNFYMALVVDTGKFKLYREIDGKLEPLKDWTPTDILLANDWNRLAVKGVGSEFTLYINDQEVARVTDTSLPTGRVRLATQLLDTASPASVDFDNFEVRLPGTAVATASTPAAPPPPPPTQPPAPPSPPKPQPPAAGVAVVAQPPAPPAPATQAPAPPPPPTEAPPPPPPTEQPPPPPPTAARPTPTPPPTTVALPPTPEGWTGGIPTVVASDVSTWPMVFFDTFDDNGNNWPIGEDFDRLVEASKVIDQTLAWQFKGVQGVFSMLEVPYPAVSDFYVAVDVKRYTGPVDAQYGLTFRRQDPDNFYSFLVSDEQKFEARVQAKDKWYPLIGVTKTKAIRPGQSNRIAVKCEGPRIQCFINGTQVMDVQDIRFRKGTIALTLSVKQADMGIMEFDNFELRTPAGQ